MARKLRNLPQFLPVGGAFALGTAVMSLAVLSGGQPTRPWKERIPTPRAATRVPLHRVVYHPQPVTIRPPELLALSGRAAPESTFRVQLTNVLQEGALKVYSTSGLLVVDAETHRLVAQVPGEAVYTVSMSADGRALSGPTGTDLPGNRIRIQPISPDTPMETGKRSYLGALDVRLGARGLEVINEVHQEDYIAGVVAGEAARSFPLEALKAQAVAARTYAMSQRGHRGTDFDVVDTVADQVYTGAGVAWPEVKEAVRETAGQVLTYRGKPIIAYFSADCGGYTRTNTAGGLGNSPLPYLRAVRDADAGGRDYCATSPKHTWSLRLTEADILPKLNAKLKLAAETLKEIRFTQIFSDGRVGEVSVLGLGVPPKPADGNPVKASPRKQADGSSRGSSLIVLAATATPTSPASPDAPSNPSPSELSKPEETVPETPALKAPEAPAEPVIQAAPATPAAPTPTEAPAPPASPKVLEPPAEPVSPSAPQAPVAPSETGPVIEAPSTETGEAAPPEIRRFLQAYEFRKIVGTNLLRSQIMSVAPDGEGAWLFSGRGYGHGVGLCQWGACGMAREGIPYERILHHYYSDVTLEPTAPRNGTLTGIAKDADGKPLANATITLAGTDRETKTDAQGKFRFEALPAASYDIVVTPTAGPSAMSFAWSVRPNDTTEAAV